MALLRLVVLAVIQAYRQLVSPILPRSCRFEPTCSAYGLEAINRFGAIAGGWLTVRRFLRCHPWGGAGFDPVPEPAPIVGPEPTPGCGACAAPGEAAPRSGSAR